MLDEHAFSLMNDVKDSLHTRLTSMDSRTLRDFMLRKWNLGQVPRKNEISMLVCRIRQRLLHCRSSRCRIRQTNILISFFLGTAESFNLRSSMLFQSCGSTNTWQRIEGTSSQGSCSACIFLEGAEWCTCSTCLKSLRLELPVCVSVYVSYLSIDRSTSDASFMFSPPHLQHREESKPWFFYFFWTRSWTHPPALALCLSPHRHLFYIFPPSSRFIRYNKQGFSMWWWLHRAHGEFYYDIYCRNVCSVHLFSSLAFQRLPLFESFIRKF